MEDSFDSIPIPSQDSPQNRPSSRALSPSRSFSSVYDFENSSDPIYKQAMKKISEGCSRFSKERDGMLLTVKYYYFSLINFISTFLNFFLCHSNSYFLFSFICSLSFLFLF